MIPANRLCSTGGAQTAGASSAAGSRWSARANARFADGVAAGPDFQGGQPAGAARSVLAGRRVVVDLAQRRGQLTDPDWRTVQAMAEAVLRRWHEPSVKANAGERSA